MTSIFHYCMRSQYNVLIQLSCIRENVEEKCACFSLMIPYGSIVFNAYRFCDAFLDTASFYLCNQIFNAKFSKRIDRITPISKNGIDNFSWIFACFLKIGISICVLFYVHSPDTHRAFSLVFFEPNECKPRMSCFGLRACEWERVRAREWAIESEIKGITAYNGKKNTYLILRSNCNGFDTAHYLLMW